MFDYWYVGDYVYRDSVNYVPAVVHVLHVGHPKTLTVLEEDVGEQVVNMAQVVEEKKTEEKKEPVAVLYFDFDSAKVKPEEREKLKVLEKDKTYSLVGYACWIGDKRYNYKLSLRRAEAVKREVERMGFRVGGIESKGESQCRQKKDLWQCRKVEVWE